jgi:hypothetical protein
MDAPHEDLVTMNHPMMQAFDPDNGRTAPHAMAPPAPGYQRYREMTLDELLLENRVVFV